MYRLVAILCLQLLIVTLVSCTKDTDDQKDTFTLSSEKPEGFSLTKMQIVGLPNNVDVVDFLVSSQTNNEGELVGTFLSHPRLEPVFYLNETFADLATAEVFFNNLDTGDQAEFSQFAFMLHAYQVWTIRCSEGQNGKILILDARTYLKENNPVAEVMFKAGRD
jgi:hypothetical protein